jgi:hypothetical protein
MFHFNSIYRESQLIANEIKDICKTQENNFKKYIIENIGRLTILWDYVEKHHMDLIDDHRHNLGSLMQSHLLKIIAPACSINSYFYQYAMHWTLLFFQGITLFGNYKQTLNAIRNSTSNKTWSRHVENLFYDELYEMMINFNKPRQSHTYTDAFYDQVEKELKLNVFCCTIELTTEYIPIEFTIKYELVESNEIVQETYKRTLNGYMSYNKNVHCTCIFKKREYTKTTSFQDEGDEWIPTYRILDHVINNPTMLPTFRIAECIPDALHLSSTCTIKDA